MKLEYYAGDRVEIISGGINVFTGLLEEGRFWNRDTAAAVVSRSAGGDEYFVFTREDLEDILDDVRRGVGLAPALSRSTTMPTSTTRRRPRRPAVALESGEIVGVWLRATTAPRRSPSELVHAVRQLIPPQVRPRARAVDMIDPLGGVTAAERPGGGSGGGSGRHGRATPERTETAEPTIRRTPHIEAPDTIATAPGSSFPVVVRTDTADFRAHERGGALAIEMPAEMTEVTVVVSLDVTEHFVVEGDASKPLTISRDQPDSAPVTFTVRVTDTDSPRHAGVEALFLYRGRTCGGVSVEWAWDPKQPTASAVRPTADFVSSIPLHVDVEQPDLSVLLRAPVNDGLHFQCAAFTPLLPQYSEPVFFDCGFQEQTSMWVAGLLADLVDALKTSDERRQALDEAGIQLFDAAPPRFKEVLWAMVDAGKKPRSVYIASVEPSLPWELMIPTRPPDRQPSRLRPLGVEFAVGRWTRGDAQSPPQLMPIHDSLVVAPEYQQQKLDTSAEVELVEERLRGKRIEPATKAHLKSYVGKHHASLLHFACHGNADVANDDAIDLENKDVLRSIEVRASPEFQALCEARAPLVFINACETGQLVPAIGGLAGFPYAFGMIGARAVIAPMWPVDNKLAHEVARKIYETALEPDAPPVAEVVRSIREGAYAKSDADTYAAYCFYGDPLARLRLVEPPE